MIIYFAGNVTIPREEKLIIHKTNRLFSFYYHGTEGEFHDEFKKRIESIKQNRNMEHKNVLPLTHT